MGFTHTSFKTLSRDDDNSAECIGSVLSPGHVVSNRVLLVLVHSKIRMYINRGESAEKRKIMHVLSFLFSIFLTCQQGICTETKVNADCKLNHLVLTEPDNKGKGRDKLATRFSHHFLLSSDLIIFLANHIHFVLVFKREKGES